MESKSMTPQEIPARDDPRNWVEDYPHENGNYLCHCYNCQRQFFGYKRRVICKECNDKYESDLSKSQKEIIQLKEEIAAKDRHMNDLKDELAGMEKAIDDYQVRDTKQQEQIEMLKKWHKSSNDKVEAAIEIIFQYWRKEHEGIPDYRIQDEWELYKSENYI